MTFGDVSSSVACCAPGSDVTTSERSVVARVGTKRIGAVWLDSAFMWNSWFAEVSTNLAAFVFSFEQNVKRFGEPWPVLFGSPSMDWHVRLVCDVEFCQMEWREIVFVVRDVVRISNSLFVLFPDLAEDGVPHVSGDVG